MFPWVGHGAGPLQLRVQPAPSAYLEYKGAEGGAGWRPPLRHNKDKDHLALCE
jgi:hypothetical protein